MSSLQLSAVHLGLVFNLMLQQQRYCYVHVEKKDKLN